MTELTVADVVTRVFTTENPETGSAPPEHVAWVIFRHETVFLTAPTDELPVSSTPDALVRAALKTLIRFGPPVPGTASADFQVTRLPWWPDAFVFMVSYDHPNLFNVVIADDEMSDLGVGIMGRSVRKSDAEEPSVIEVRAFDGQAYRVQAKEEIGRVDYSK